MEEDDDALSDCVSAVRYSNRILNSVANNSIRVFPTDSPASERFQWKSGNNLPLIVTLRYAVLVYYAAPRIYRKLIATRVTKSFPRKYKRLYVENYNSFISCAVREINEL